MHRRGWTDHTPDAALLFACHYGVLPTFCRHNRLTQNCPICSREQNVKMRPLVSGGPASATETRDPDAEHGHITKPASGKPRATRASGRSSGAALKVRRLTRGVEDGFTSRLLPGLKSSSDAERLVRELAFATTRLAIMASAPQGLWQRIADPAGDIEERTWLAFLLAYIGASDGDDPFGSVEAAAVSWESGQTPDWDAVERGPRGSFTADGADATVESYRIFVARAGSQIAAFVGEPSWAPERRFERLFERLASKGFGRDARFEMLVLLGRLGVYDLRAAKLALAGENEATWAGKRAMGIADPILLERRVLDFAIACEAPTEALDLALHNWGSGTRFGDGVASDAPEDEAVLEAGFAALRLAPQAESE